MDEKVLNLLGSLFNGSLDDTTDAKQVADSLKISRNRASSYLNLLVDGNKVIKVNTRPVVFFHKNKLENFFQTSLPNNQFISMTDLVNQIKKNIMNPFSEVIGHDSSLENIIFQCKAAAAYSTNGLPTMLVGKSGTGKSYLAKKIYEFTKLESIIGKNSPFIHVNCSDYADNPDFFIASLFGSVKGAYTGAYKDTSGLLDKAQDGYLFLDEIHALNSNCQEKLFQLMDTSKYHKLGDNEKWFHSNVRFLFATTEYPSEKLLSTLLRRIPVILSLPSLNERDNNEKIALITYLLEKEQKKIDKSIKLSHFALDYLLSKEFSGNVGELSNKLKLAVAKESYLSNNQTAYLDEKSFDAEEINTKNISGSFENEYRDIAELVNYYDEKSPIINLIKDIRQEEPFYNLKNISELKDFFKKIWKGFHKYKVETYNNFYMSDKFKYEVKKFDAFLRKAFKNNDTYFAFFQKEEPFEEISMILTLLSINDSFNHLPNHDLEKLNRYIKETEILLNKEFNFSNYLIENLSYQSKLCAQLAQLAIIAFIEVFSISSTQNSQVGLIMAHGKAVATEIAHTVNQMLNSYIFESINLPLDVNTKEVSLILQDWIKIKKNSETILVFTDMGSLTKLKDLNFDISANVVFINSINPPLILSLGNDLLQKETVKVLEKNALLINNQFEVSSINNKEKKNCIICSSGSGKEADTKIKYILEKSFPKGNKISITTVDFDSLSTVGLSDDFLENHDVKFIIGTLDPNIASIPFISIGDLIADRTVSFLNYVLSDLLDESELKELSKNLLTEFALTNLVNQLTILNPKKLLSLVTTAIEDIQKQVRFTIPINTSFGLYIHTCCMIERLIRTSQFDDAMDDENVEPLSVSFTKIFKKSFIDIESFYSVKIPYEEINYIKNYIYND